MWTLWTFFGFLPSHVRARARVCVGVSKTSTTSTGIGIVIIFPKVILVDVGIHTSTNVHDVHQNVHEIGGFAPLEGKLPAPHTLIRPLGIDPKLAPFNVEHAVAQSPQRLAKPRALRTIAA